MGHEWKVGDWAETVHFLDAFSRFKFEDGTPFGVLES